MDISDKSIAVAGDMGAALAKGPRVDIVIAGEGPWLGGINGYFFRIKRGVRVSVPESLYMLIKQSERVEKLSKAVVAPFTGAGKRL